MKLQDFIEEITRVMGKPKHISPHDYRDYPDLKIVEPLPEIKPKYGEAWWNEDILAKSK